MLKLKLRQQLPYETLLILLVVVKYETTIVYIISAVMFQL